MKFNRYLAVSFIVFLIIFTIQSITIGMPIKEHLKIIGTVLIVYIPIYLVFGYKSSGDTK